MLPLGDPKHQTELEVTALGNQLAGERMWSVSFPGLLWPFFLPEQSFQPLTIGDVIKAIGRRVPCRVWAAFDFCEQPLTSVGSGSGRGEVSAASSNAESLMENQG